MNMFRYPPDSPYREQRLASLMPSPEAIQPTVAAETPEGGAVKRLGGAMTEGIREAVANPEARAKLEQKTFQLRTNLAVKTAFKNACANRTFARESEGRTYGVTVGVDGKALVYYNTKDGRHFVAPTQIDLGAQGIAVPQSAIVQQIEKSMAEEFSQVLTTGTTTNNE